MNPRSSISRHGYRLSIFTIAILAICINMVVSDGVLAGSGDAVSACKTYSTDKLKRLTENIARINLGDSRLSVESVVGPYDVKEDVVNKECYMIHGVEKNCVHNGVMLDYVAKQCSPSGKVGNNDQFVRLLFDKNNLLVEIAPYEVPGIKHREKDLPPDGHEDK
jgi:hypothetical protein